MIEDTFVTYCEIKTGMLADDASKAMEGRAALSTHRKQEKKKVYFRYLYPGNIIF